MDIETLIRSEADQKEKQISCSLAYMWNLETWYRWTYLQSRNRDTDAENKCMDNEGGVRKGVLLLSCWAMFDLVDCSSPGSSALHYLLEFAKIYSVSQWCYPTIPSSAAHFSCPQSCPASGSFPMSRLFASGDQRVGTSALATDLSMINQS